MKFNHWSQHPELRNKSFLAINLTNHDEETRQFNDALFAENRTGRWDIKIEVLRAGLVNKFVVLFYSAPGSHSTLYIGKIKATEITGETDHNLPRDRYELEVYDPWEEIGETDVSYKRFFDGVTMRASPTAVWVDASRNLTEHTNTLDDYSNNYCEAWLEGRWKRVLVAEARMHSNLLVRCFECKGNVVLMKAGVGGTSRAHSEHRPVHKGCSLAQKFDGVRRPHPNPVQDPIDGMRDPFADLIVNEDDESAFPEGAESYQLHKKRERDPSIVLLAKAKRLKEAQRLECEICLTDFHLVYGVLGQGFIEAHHKIPVSQLDGMTRTRIDDLALVCSNCHRMLHRSGGRTVDELRALVQGSKTPQEV
jgi:5-methylcytosine-specific restriction endonuclease McrA